jgi:hypothetical protein
LFGRHPFEMGCVQWWSGRVWAWLLLVVAIALRVQVPVMYDPEPPLTNATLTANQSMELNATSRSEPLSAIAPWVARPEALEASAAALFVVWLASHLAFFRLCKREYWASFRTIHTAAACVRLKWEAAQSDEKRAALLVKLHPAVLRLVEADARLFIEAHWEEGQDDRPAWMTDRWLSGVPSSMLPKQALQALGGKHRRKSTLPEQLALLSDKAVPDPVAVPIAVQPESVVVPIAVRNDAVSPTERRASEFLVIALAELPKAGDCRSQHP